MRKNRLAPFLTVLSLAAATVAADPAPATPADAAFGWLGTLAGSCWRGEYATGGGDTQCYTLQYGRYLRGTIAIESVGKDGKPFRLAGDSVFEWDAASARIRYSNWADLGNLQHGEAFYDGELLRFPDVKSRDEEPRTRSTWRRIDADSFEVTRERREGDAWQALFSVTYRRAAPVAPAGDPPR
jgi:hypothetical protein